MDGITAITSATDLDRIIAAVAQITPWAVPLYRAVRAGDINLITPQRDAQVQKAVLANTRRPCVVLLGDDDYRSTGPAGWACARRVRAWGGGAVLHATGGEARHYEAAVAAAVAYQRLILVETASTQQDAWLAFLAPKPVHLITNRDSAPHPATPNKERVQ